MADGLTGNQFLTWDRGDQASYLQTQLVMAGSIAARVKPPLSDCIADNFFAETGGISEAGHDRVLDNVREFTDFHPSSVLVVTIEAACGSF